MLAVISFVGAGLLAVLLPSTWPLLVARIVLICLGVAVVVIGLRQRQRRGSNAELLWRQSASLVVDRRDPMP